MTTIDRRIDCLANRSHGQGVVVKKDLTAKSKTNSISVSEKVEKVIWNLLKLGNNDFALITTHAKLDISNGRARKGFSFPMKDMTVSVRGCFVMQCYCLLLCFSAILQ